MESLDCPNALAKQVRSQLSYTPTIVEILRYLAGRENSEPKFCPESLA